MKVPVRAFLVVSATSPYPDRTLIFIGGVAKSVAHEVASEESGVVVELTGEYETSDLEILLKDRLEDLKDDLTRALSPKELKSTNDQIEYYQKALDYIKTASLTQLTNLLHFSKDELQKYSGK